MTDKDIPDRDSEKKASEIEKILVTKHAVNLGSDIKGPYQRSNYENKSKMNEFREEFFNGKKTAEDVYTKETLHRGHKAAKNKYGQNASKHQAEIDHTTPLKNLHDFGKELPHITEDDIRIAANREHNYQAIAKKTNASKGEQTNFEYVKKHPELPTSQKVTMVVEGAKADLLTKGELVCKSAIEDIKSGGTVVTTAGAKNLAQLMNGEKTLPEACVGFVGDTVTGEISQIAIKQGVRMTQAGINNMNKQLAKVVGEQGVKKIVGDTIGKGLAVVSQNVGAIVSAAMCLGDSVIKFANGQISGEELICEIGEKGTGLVCMEVGAEIGAAVGSALGSFAPGIGNVVGMFLGKVVGGAIGYLIGEKICGMFKKFMQPSRVEEFNRYKKIYDEFAEQVAKSRRELEEYLEYVHLEQQKNICESFEHIKECMMNNDVDGIAAALDNISLQFNVESNFCGKEEFRQKVSEKNFTFCIGAKS